MLIPLFCVFDYTYVDLIYGVYVRVFLSKETLDGKKKSHNMGHIVVELFLFLYHTMWIM